MSARKRIILATLGSYGDIHPYMAIAAELRARDEDHLEFINNMKAVISANLRTLLS